MTDVIQTLQLYIGKHFSTWLQGQPFGYDSSVACAGEHSTFPTDQIWAINTTFTLGCSNQMIIQVIQVVSETAIRHPQESDHSKRSICKQRGQFGPALSLILSCFYMVLIDRLHAFVFCLMLNYSAVNAEVVASLIWTDEKPRLTSISKCMNMCSF